MFTRRTQELLDRDAQLGAKKLQLLEDLAHVVPGNAAFVGFLRNDWLANFKGVRSPKQAKPRRAAYYMK